MITPGNRVISQMSQAASFGLGHLVRIKKKKKQDYLADFITKWRKYAAQEILVHFGLKVKSFVSLSGYLS